MSELVADCPRCDSQKITFTIAAANLIGRNYGWQGVWELFGICRHCQKATIHVVTQRDSGDLNRISTGPEFLEAVKSVNRQFDYRNYVSTSDRAIAGPPQHLPTGIAHAFNEASRCFAVNCPNAAGTMYRLCVDLATKELLPPATESDPPYKVRRDLGLRLPWLFKNERLPKALEPLSQCIREDGNDGAHAGTLKLEDAEDLRDFTFELLEQLYTAPEKLKIAEQRRSERRRGKL